MKQFFYLSELIVYIFIIIFQHSIIKYLGIILCFLYTLSTKKGYSVFILIVIADYFLLFDEHYIIGMLLFIGVHCFYHHMMSQNHSFYLFLCLLIYPSIYTIGICYAFLTLYNITNAFLLKHWLLITLILLAACDICVLLQYIFNTNIDLIWIFYLPSQVYFSKMVSSNEDETIVKVN